MVRPNEGEKWERAKFRFRSSLFVLVTLVDTWAVATFSRSEGWAVLGGGGLRGIVSGQT